MDDFPFLSKIESPADLRALDRENLPAVADELREFLIQGVARCGGHFGASLGAVELTVALHYAFNTPEDWLVWDVGHQSYGHKILTGRRDQLETIRRWGGLAPFPERHESPYDSFGVGHSSTSISAALGMALASRNAGKPCKSVAVIGDGGLTAGLAYEALNHLGVSEADVLVILNDNEMSISPNVGAMSRYLTRLLAGSLYSSVRETGQRMLSTVPRVKKFAMRVEGQLKGMILPAGMLFEELGVQYFGPVGGHDVLGLLEVIEKMRDQTGPRLLHVITQKGMGYEPAEGDPVGYHAVPTFDPEIGVEKKGSSGRPTYTQVFGEWLCDQAAADSRLMAITPAMREGSGLVRFEKEHPDRYFDVGIAEQHSVAVGAGMACAGAKPVVAIYSTFLQRGYDQLVHDIVVQELDVLLAIDRAGMVGNDGKTHVGAFDLSYLRCLPGVVIMAPSDENECRKMLTTGFLHEGPAAVRYPRGKGPGTEVEKTLEPIPIGKARKIREGREIAFLVFGSLLDQVAPIAEELDATLVDMRFVKPLDIECLNEVAGPHSLLVTVEDNVVAGGAGSAVSEALDLNGSVRLLQLGLPDHYVEHGTREEQLASVGLDTEGIRKSVAESQAKT
ncbi:MAG: 1-deoxy-D-xylulose-5-phosphate synthase [Gammaproteobacteria bacterium]|nr:1-deoxy-D-xylulose-5-phosphate synthase [Gammaproteobacteria bacterium]MDE0302605.1 1-deoxy-D-xylulose-5-phosphate synthase [Gammaproteobacteria bacterium]